MSLLLVVRFLHIASAIWFIGGVVARQIVRAYAKRTEDVQRFAVMSEAAGRIEIHDGHPREFCSDSSSASFTA